MATKTFKIGLSNAEKQAMAQDVYERLLDLTFPEYDPTQNYNVGDFVVYNDQLYKCIEGTTGAWDSSKWQLATFNDLLTDIEDAVQFVNDKANVDGNYPTMTVGVADNLSPYDESSGINQSEPFNFQASGTNNGADPLASVGELALLKEKRGNTVVVNQLAKEFNTNNYRATNGTLVIADGVMTYTVTNAIGYFDNSIRQDTKYTGTHKLLLFGIIECSESLKCGISYNGAITYKDCTANTKEMIFGIAQSISEYPLQIGIESIPQVGTTLKVYNLLVIDLTQWFNGDIPQDLLDNPENFFRYYQGSLAYNEGTLVNADGRYLKAIGRQQWDEEYVNGYFGGDGTFYESGLEVASKNGIKVIPNATYYFKNPTTTFLSVLEFDNNDNFIGIKYISNNTLTISSNASYIKFSTNSSYGGTYNNNITISLYYEGEGGYDEYYPYEELVNVDTGSEVLRSAGSVADIKLPSGEIKRNVGSVELGDLSISFYEQVWNLRFADQSIPVPPSTSGNLIISGLRATDTWQDCYDNDLTCIISNNVYGPAIVIHDNSCTTETELRNKYGSVIANYELATPTTEQGTPYSENVEINDFGSMDFSGTNGVPQGNLLFYPVDYKAFLDTLHNYSDADPSNLALKSDLVGLVKQEDLSSEITEIASGLTYVLKKAYKTGNVVNLTIDVENNTGSAINENTTLFAIGSDLLPIPSQLNIIGYYAGDYCRVQINKSGQVGNVSINKQFELAGKLTLLVSYAVA